MLKITKQSDYGIVLLTRIASEPNRLWAAPELAQEAHLPLPIVSKVLKILARGGVLSSHRGAKGGYTLTRPPAATSIATVIDVLEGTFALTDCIDGAPGACHHESVCPQRANWQVINRAVRRALEQISVADMAQPLPSELVQLGGRLVAAR
jgi:FeS assembly SUF system regulator